MPKTPTPSPGTSPSAPTPSLPNYQGAAQTPVAPSSGSNDIWGLGNLYGRPVYLGTTPAPMENSRGGIPVFGHGPQSATNSFGTTQDIMQQAVDLWSQQQQERKHDPHSLTGYEQLQQELYASGFYGQTSFDKIHVGQWTEQTRSALDAALGQYEQVMTGAQQPVTFTEFLQGNTQQNGDGGFYGSKGAGPGGAQAPVQVNLADPNAIRSAAQSAAQAALGAGLSSDQLDKFVAQFQAEQTAAQTSTASSATNPDLSSQAMAFAQQSDPNAYKGNQRQAFLNTLVNMFAPSGSQRPGMTPVPSVGG